MFITTSIVRVESDRKKEAEPSRSGKSAKMGRDEKNEGEREKKGDYWQVHELCVDWRGLQMRAVLFSGAVHVFSPTETSRSLKQKR